MSYVFNRKRTAVIGISADFKGGNSGEGGIEDVTIRGISLLGRGVLKCKVFKTVSPKSIKPVKLPVFD